MIEATKQEVSIERVSGDALHVLLTFSYTGSIAIDEDNVDEIVGAASMLAMVRVELLCEQYLFAEIVH